MLGRTFAIGGDLPVSRLGFGTAQLTGPGYWGPRGEPAEAAAVLRRAVECGITLIDTADNYGPNIAEELIAEALHPYPADLVIATKGGVVRTGPDSWHIAGRPEDLKAMCEASLRRLRVETIDLYQLHRLDPAVPLADQLGTLAELRRAGKIRHIGLDTVTTEQLEQSLAITPIASIQNRYNLLDRAYESVLEFCEVRGIAFLPWFPLANGLLAADSGSAAITEIALAHGTTAGQIALAWLLHRSPVLLPTPGTGSVSHLDENQQATELALTTQEMDQLEELCSSSSRIRS